MRKTFLKVVPVSVGDRGNQGCPTGLASVCKAIGLFLVVALVLPMSGACQVLSPGNTGPAPVIRQIASQVGANAYLVETARHVVLIDAGFTVQDGATMVQEIAATGKPLAAILLTHAHIDHYGAAALIAAEAEVPILATVRTRREIESMDATFERRVESLFGDAVPSNRRFPNQTIQGGDAYEVDGVAFVVHDFGPGESMGDAVWMLQDGDSLHAFVGDLVTGGIHGFFQAGHARDWQHNLQFLADMLQAKARIYPGHGAPGGAELLDWQSTYIDQFLSTVQTLLENKALTSEQRTARLTEKMTALYPDLTGLFLIAWSEEIVANELRVEAAQRQLTNHMREGFGQ